MPERPGTRSLRRFFPCGWKDDLRMKALSRTLVATLLLAAAVRSWRAAPNSMSLTPTTPAKDRFERRSSMRTTRPRRRHRVQHSGCGRPHDHPSVAACRRSTDRHHRWLHAAGRLAQHAPRRRQRRPSHRDRRLEPFGGASVLDVSGQRNDNSRDRPQPAGRRARAPPSPSAEGRPRRLGQLHRHRRCGRCRADRTTPAFS